MGYNQDMRNGEQLSNNPFEAAMWRAFKNGDFDDIVKRYEEMGYGGQTPVPHEVIKGLPNGEVKLNENCTEYIKVAMEYTQAIKKELPFVMIGETDGESNTVNFDKFYTVGPEDVPKLAAQECDPNLVFERNAGLVGDFKDAIAHTNGVGSHAVFCFGHTHPDLTDYYGTYDTQDLRNIIQHDDSIDGVRRSVGDDRAQVMDCVVMANGDVDFMFFDKNVEEFYKIKKVVGKTESGQSEEMQNYQFKTPLPR